MSDGSTQWFRGTSGWVWAGIAAATVVVVLGFDIAGGFHPEVAAGSLFALVVAYVVMVRPAVGVVGDDLVIRHMVSTVTIPVAAVRSVYVGRMLEAKAGGRTFASPAVNRSLGQVIRGDRHRKPESVFADFVENRIEGLAAGARSRQGIATDSDEHFALAEQYRRTWAWPEIAALVLSGGLLLVLLLT